MKGNNEGTGFFRFYDKQINIGLHSPLRVIFHSDKSIDFFTKLSYYDGFGFYLPKNIMLENNLSNKRVKCEVKRIIGFYSKLDRYYRLTIPLKIINNSKLKKNDIVLLKLFDNERIFKFYTKLSKRNKRNEYKALIGIRSNLQPNKSYIVEIVKKLKRCAVKRSPKHLFLNDVFKLKETALFDENNIIVFHGKGKPIILPQKIKFNEIAFYLGCYFSDGTRVGEHWRISASTPNQAKFYIEKHRSLIKNAELNYRLTFTNIDIQNKDNDKIKRNLINFCDRSIGIILDKNKIKIYDGSPNTLKHNPYGTLDIIENSITVLYLYNKLLDLILKKVIKTRDKNLAIEFLCGVLEGDGTINAVKRGHLMIATNAKDSTILEKVLKVANIRYWLTREDKNKLSIRIGALEILKLLPIVKSRIFIYYPKRRRALVERLKSVGAVKFILGKQDYCSSWVKVWLKNEGILNKEYQLTAKGLKIKNCLSHMIDEVTVK